MSAITEMAGECQQCGGVVKMSVDFAAETVWLKCRECGRDVVLP